MSHLYRQFCAKLIPSFIRKGKHSGGFLRDPRERELMRRLEKLHQIRLQDIMTPRAEIIALDFNDPFSRLIETIDTKMYSRFPVKRGSLDYMIGCIETKDILRIIRGDKAGQTAMLRPYLRKVHFTTPNKLAVHLLLELRDKQRHLAIIVDEFGGVDGMVTMEDLAAEIVGFYEDTYDDEELVASLPNIASDRVVVPARLSIDDFENHYGWNISPTDPDEDDKPDTLGGLVVALAERVPNRGEVISDPQNGIEYVIVEADARRVHRIQMIRRPKQPQ